MHILDNYNISTLYWYMRLFCSHIGYPETPIDFHDVICWKGKFRLSNVNTCISIHWPLRLKILFEEVWGTHVNGYTNVYTQLTTCWFVDDSVSYPMGLSSGSIFVDVFDLYVMSLSLHAKLSHLKAIGALNQRPSWVPGKSWYRAPSDVGIPNDSMHLWGPYGWRYGVVMCGGWNTTRYGGFVSLLSIGGSNNPWLSNVCGRLLNIFQVLLLEFQHSKRLLNCSKLFSFWPMSPGFFPHRFVDISGGWWLKLPSRSGYKSSSTMPCSAMIKHKPLSKSSSIMS